jgi:hypothetical protein
MLTLIILIAWRGALAELAIGPVRATNQNEPDNKTTLLTMACLKLLFRHGCRYDNAPAASLECG